ncbi:uncharacterized protein FMAN_04109 [Fusarium mangiferae]|uniref:Uncharacterized protein n=1 Tax=Fusarium mangiferae TaxID=192010 RepID=A0A1L7ST71_FUSMA|nr:uncharacterized protein FMAN_04109 [Fusarium mangiferae]CVK89748.1 uncharacterized protein FMAN_04109 [Fusarium mangiferae]
MSDSVIDLDLTEIHFDFFCKVGGTPQMLHALIAAQEDDVKRWSSCPSFGPFIQKLFVQPPNVSRLGLIHPTGCISIEQCGRSSCFRAVAVEAPVDDAASVTLHRPSDGEPFPFPIRDILAKFYEYGQYELHKVRIAIRFDNKTIKYVDAQAFPSENFPESRNKGQLKKFNTVDSVDERHDVVDCGRRCMKLDIPTAFKEHLEVIEDRMRDNGYNIKIHVPDDIIESEISWLEGLNKDSDYDSFDLGAHMEVAYFMPLICSAVLGTIKNGEFAVFEDDDGDFVLRENHKIDDRFLPKAATKKK